MWRPIKQAKEWERWHCLYSIVCGTFLLVSIHITSLYFGWVICISVLPVIRMNELCTSLINRQNWTIVQVLSLSRSHMKHHKSLNVWKVGANQVHLKLPGATPVGNDFKFHCWSLHGGHSFHTERENAICKLKQLKNSCCAFFWVPKFKTVCHLSTPWAFHNSNLGKSGAKTLLYG